MISSLSFLQPSTDLCYTGSVETSETELYELLIKVGHTTNGRAETHCEIKAYEQFRS